MTKGRAGRTGQVTLFIFPFDVRGIPSSRGLY